MILMKELIEEISMGPFGSDIKVDSFVDFGVPVLNGSNVSGVKLEEKSFNYVTIEKANSLKKANTQRGDIVITHRGTLGQISYIPENSKFNRYVISQSQFRLRLNRKKLNPIFFTYYFHSNEGQKRLLSFKNHVGVPALAQATTNFRLLEFPLIPLKDQNQIAKVLSDLDAKIELNNRINAELEGMAKLIYDFWFVQFDFPTSTAQAQAMGKPELEGKPYKSSGGKMVYNEELKREIPEGWDVQPLMKFGNIVTGKTPSVNNPEHFGDSLPFFTPVDFTGIQKIKITAERGISSAGELALKRYILPKKSILITCIGSDMGKVSINYGRGISNQQINSLKPFNPSHVDYLYHSISLIIPYLKTLGKSGSTVPIVNKSTLERIKFINPPIDILKSYNKLTDPKNELIAVGLKQNQHLSSLRNWLLPMLMNEQVKVGEVAEKLGMAAEPEVNYEG
jgi:type I restriction enzyme S subunit